MAGMEVDDGSNRVGGKRNFPGSRTFGPRIPQVCRFWQEGRCLKGDACQWQHPVAPETSGRFSGSSEPLGYKKSNYSIDNRAGAHVASIGTNGSGGQRRWGRKQQLQNLGEKVPFDSKRPLRDTVCLYWIRGNCNRGNNCNFLHSYTTASDFDIMTKLKGHEKAVRGIALPTGSSLLYTGGQDQTVRVWDCDTGKCSSVVPMGGDVGALLSESGWLFVGLPNEVKAWNMQTAAQQSLSGPKGQVHALAIISDLLFAGSQDGSILAWKFNFALNAFEPAASLWGHTGAVIALQTAGGRLYSGSMDKSIMVWDLSNGQCLQTLHGHSNVVMSLLCWEQFLLSCSLDGFIKVWQANASGTLEVAYTFPEDSEAAGSLDVSWPLLISALLGEVASTFISSFACFLV
ncbi:hypothetical protein O6H91_Y547900 [Diphasiastrum complanatum]|nr:hypothetical protein O6H91_Y547900 [Diphasiastrum complanatum]